MRSLVVNQDKVDPARIPQLLRLCPFGAIEAEGDVVSVNAACRMCGICVRRWIPGAFEIVEVNEAAIDKSAWQGVAVFIDHSEGSVHPVSLELIGKARELAAVSGQPVYAVLIGHDVAAAAEQLLYYGVDHVFTYDEQALRDFRIEPYAAAFADFVDTVRPSSVLVGATNVGRSLAPRVAARCRTGLTADCTTLEMRPNTDLVQIRPAFGGNIMAQIRTPNHRPQFCTVRYGVCPMPIPSSTATGKITAMQVDPALLLSRIEVLEATSKPRQAGISEADVIIALGRGVRSRRDLPLFEEMAGMIGAQLACTRPLIEAGWFDPRLQIGLSGRTVKPKLIICAGLSGSVQFRAGMLQSKVIVAINHDPLAAIFDVAHLGLVGDIYEVLPQVVEQVKATRDGRAQE
jgi:electron transfer flavoprotein alpha subunit